MTKSLGKAPTCLNAYRTVRSNTRLNYGSLKFGPHLQSQQRWPQIVHRPPSETYATSKSESRFLQKNETTIYALSTAPGRAAIAIIRISGPACMNIYNGICPGKPSPKPRYATLRSLYDPRISAGKPQVLDPNALVLYFPGPQTVTGEDVLEFHIHGGTAVVNAVLNAIPDAIPEREQIPGSIRYAEPGEFTRRAFYNDRLDLSEVEALGDILSAETEQQRQLATRGIANLTKEYELWRQLLVYARGELEALIDFSEDQHFDESPRKLLASVRKQIEQLRETILLYIKNSFRGELLRNGISVALLGAPNAGKSTLLNTIVGREAAIVNEKEGTTRDIVEVGVDIGGFFCRLSDLAGLREIAAEGNEMHIGDIELEGMRRARERVLNADVVIIVLSAEAQNMTAAVAQAYTACNSDAQQTIIVVTKSDLLQEPQAIWMNNETMIHQQGEQHSNAKPQFLVSCKQAQFAKDNHLTDHEDPGGIQAFLQGLQRVFQQMTSAVGAEGQDRSIDKSMWEQSLGVSERQRSLLQTCLKSLDAFLDSATSPEVDDHSGALEEAEVDIVVAAENLRAAADCLAKVTGKATGDVEEILGVVFEKFCVGK